MPKVEVSKIDAFSDFWALLKSVNLSARTVRRSWALTVCEKGRNFANALFLKLNGSLEGLTILADFDQHIVIFQATDF